jgi:hypothetical protein
MLAYACVETDRAIWHTLVIDLPSHLRQGFGGQAPGRHTRGRGTRFSNNLCERPIRMPDPKAIRWVRVAAA